MIKTDKDVIKLFVDMYNNKPIRDIALLSDLLSESIEYIGFNSKDKGNYEWAINKKQTSNQHDSN